MEGHHFHPPTLVAVTEDLLCRGPSPACPFLTLSCCLLDRNAAVQKVFNGHLRVLNWEFLDAYENSSSPEFMMLAKKVKSTVRGFLPPSSCLQDFFFLPCGHGDLA